jgi:hypothetical protein
MTAELLTVPRDQGHVTLPLVRRQLHFQCTGGLFGVVGFGGVQEAGTDELVAAFASADLDKRPWTGPSREPPASSCAPAPSTPQSSAETTNNRDRG